MLQLLAAYRILVWMMLSPEQALTNFDKLRTRSTDYIRFRFVAKYDVPETQVMSAPFVVGNSGEELKLLLSTERVSSI